MKRFRGCNQRSLRLNRSALVISPSPGAPGEGNAATASVHPADAGAAVVAPEVPISTSLATLLASHIIRDGEVVLLVLKPSFWFFIFNSVAFIVFVLMLAAAIDAVYDRRIHDHFIYETALFFIAGHLMWTTLQWMGRLYVLTDMRILRLSGIFTIDVFDCPLRKIIRTRLVSPFREKLVGVGSMEIIPKDESTPTAIWQTIRKPIEVHERVIAAINRAKQSGTGGD